MKLKEKLAKKWIEKRRLSDIAMGSSYELLLEEAFEAGFEAARKIMIKEYIHINSYDGIWIQLRAKDIMELGEEEV